MSLPTIKDYFSKIYSSLNEDKDNSESDDTAVIDRTDDDEAFAADDEESMSRSLVSVLKRNVAVCERRSRVVKRRKEARESESSSSGSLSKQRAYSLENRI